MNKLKKILLLAFFCIATFSFSQSIITGLVYDNYGEPLPGATIVEKGTKNGVATDFDGVFKITSKKNRGSIIVSFVGYTSKTLFFEGSVKLGKIILKEEADVLDAVVVKSLIDVARDRKTPVAVSTIKAEQIQEKLGAQEFPEILNTTPSVYATKSGGGYGDSRINIRGFSQKNIAVLVNGVPVNDMESSKVYWSNWAGLSDVTTGMQVQRGLGSSKLAISSVGGTINIITKTTDKTEGGTVLASYGNDNYHKFLAMYSTGKNDNGFAASFLISRTAGDGYISGTAFQGYNYFIGLGWDLNDHDFQFMLTGAPQVHNQRRLSSYDQTDISDYLRYGRKYNYNHGYLNGKEFNWNKNFFHKPLTSLSWNYNISDKASLSTSIYASFGRGGGTGSIGKIDGKYASSKSFRDSDTGLVKWDEIVKNNVGKNQGIRRAGINAHNWYGILSNFNTELTEELSLDLGFDVRDYKGEHYRRIDDLLGASSYKEKQDMNNPGVIYNSENSSSIGTILNVFKSSKDQQKIGFHNEGKVRWLGVFSQLEYSKDDLSLFVQGSVSNQAFKRIDFFNYLKNDPNRESDWVSMLGGNIKGGLNFNLTENHNLFVNSGYYSKQPFFNAVFINYKNNLINPNRRNEKAFAFELGYGFRSDRFKLNANIYRTQWKNRFTSVSYNDRAAGQEGTADIQGVGQIHTGIEIDGFFSVHDKVKLTSMLSVGDWRYDNSVTGKAFDENQNYLTDVTLYLEDVKVGDAAQTTGSFGVEADLMRNLVLDYTQRYNFNLYADVNAEDFSKVNHRGSLKLPWYSIGDIGLSYKINFGKDDEDSLNFRFNVNNVANTEYIAESMTNRFVEKGDSTYLGISQANQVFFGFGRTWNLSVRYNF